MELDIGKKIPIRVAVSGNSGSGKTSLTQKLNRLNFTRPEDGKSFQITAEEREIGAELFPEFDCAIFTFSVEEFNTFNARYVWQPLSDVVSSNYPDYRSRICFAATKVDLLVPGTRGDVNIRYVRWFIEFLAQVDVLSVSLVTDKGFSDITSWIAAHKLPLPLVEKPKPRFNPVRLLKDKILDVIASLFALPVPENVNQDTPDPFEIANDDVVDTMRQSPESIEFSNQQSLKLFGEPGCGPTSLISPTLIAKRRYPTEWGNITFARSKLRIPIPQPRYPHLDFWYVAEYIPGKMLLECWDSLSLFMKFRIACTLRGYISQMRSLTRPMPGSVLGGHVIGHVFETFMGYNGPFRHADRFNQFVKTAAFQGWGLSMLRFITDKEQGLIDASLPPNPEPIIPEDDGTLVFTHADISLANLLLTDDGTLWMVDWVDSGFYPRWLESIGMHRYQDAPKSWKVFLSFIVGPPPPQQSFWSYLHEAATNFTELEPRNKFI